MKTLLLLLSTLAVASCTSSKSLRLRHVVLYQNGIGYFEHTGRADRDHLQLHVKEYEVNDLLKTMTVIATDGKDLGATTISTAGQTSPPHRTSKHETGKSSPTQKITQHRGESKVAIDVHFRTAKNRNVTVAYAVPTPAWRPTYRIVLPDSRGEGTSLLQGWASIQNTSDEDWNDIRLTLATGAPLSFAIDMSTPQFVARPDLTGQLIKPVATGAVSSSRGRLGDADGDGIADANDLCPNDGEDMDAFEDHDGCPDPDNDEDRIADRDDQCPNDSEVYNGLDDEDGCPDRGRIVVHETNISVLDKIYFKKESSAIQPMSRPILDAIAATMMGNPDILSVEVQGHAADNEKNPWVLSRQRADSIKRSLVAQGLTASRLEVRAYGDSQPVDPKQTASARSKNRRVEFLILRRGAHDSPVLSPPGPITADTLEKGVSSSATPEDVAGAVQYRLSATVSIPRGEATLVPILNRRVAGEELFLYRPDANAPGSSKYPFRAVRLVNGADLTMTPGPIAIFARGTFVGEGLIERLYPGESAFIPYALDSSAVISVSADTEQKPHDISRVVDGRIDIADLEIRTTTYQVHPGKSPPARVYVEHVETPNYTMLELPPASENFGTTHLVPAPLTPNLTSALIVREQRTVGRTIELSDHGTTELGPYLVNSELPKETSNKLRHIIGLRTRLRHLDEQYRALEIQSYEHSQRSEELRANLRALGRGAGALRTKLSRSLTASNARYEKMARPLTELSDQRAELRIKLLEAVRQLQDTE